MVTQSSCPAVITRTFLSPVIAFLSSGLWLLIVRLKTVSSAWSTCKKDLSEAVPGWRLDGKSRGLNLCRRTQPVIQILTRSEERRVGKEGRSGWSREH